MKDPKGDKQIYHRNGSHDMKEDKCKISPRYDRHDMDGENTRSLLEMADLTWMEKTQDLSQKWKTRHEGYKHKISHRNDIHIMKDINIRSLIEMTDTS